MKKTIVFFLFVTLSVVSFSSGCATLKPKVKGTEALQEPPVIIRAPMPEYPEIARKAGVEGTVIVRMLVDKEGRIKKVVVQQSAGDGRLDGAAVEAAKGYVFKPAISENQPVSVWVSIPFNFKLKSEPEKKEAETSTARREIEAIIRTVEPTKKTEEEKFVAKDTTFTYTYYLKAIRTRILNNWNPSGRTRTLKAVVYFKILRSGLISDVSLETSSGDPKFDQLALRAVTLTGQLPPLPEDFSWDVLGIHFEFGLP